MKYKHMPLIANTFTNTFRPWRALGRRAAPALQKHTSPETHPFYEDLFPKTLRGVCKCVREGLREGLPYIRKNIKN